MGVLADLETKLESLNPATIVADLESAKTKIAAFETRIVSLEGVVASFAPAIQAVLTLLPASSAIPAEVSVLLAMLPKPVPTTTPTPSTPTA